MMKLSSFSYQDIADFTSTDSNNFIGNGSCDRQRAKLRYSLTSRLGEEPDFKHQASIIEKLRQ
jgi:hypothetical protein